VSRVLAPSGVTDFGIPIVTGRFSVYESPNDLPAAFVVSCWRLVPPGSADATMGGMALEDLRAVALVDATMSARTALPGEPPSECAPGTPAVIASYGPEQVRVTARSTGSSVLVVSDSWDPGWEATVDGDPAPVLVVDHALRGVALGPGTHTVVFAYRPDWLQLGIVITAVAAFATVGFAAGIDRVLRGVRSDRAPPRP
jgi:hypothetical protein